MAPAACAHSAAVPHCKACASASSAAGPSASKASAGWPTASKSSRAQRAPSSVGLSVTRTPAESAGTARSRVCPSAPSALTSHAEASAPCHTRCLTPSRRQPSAGVAARQPCGFVA
ncbi:hypothetical protein G6F60_014343 [Rhizopus arrhizus]|nr:hypothetical protein G6F60_014343 [Rhizopus arrhizus]